MQASNPTSGRDIPGDHAFQTPDGDNETRIASSEHELQHPHDSGLRNNIQFSHPTHNRWNNQIQTAPFPPLTPCSSKTSNHSRGSGVSSISQVMVRTDS